MIIFELDGVLADCEHRRHFIDRNHPENFKKIYGNILNEQGPPPSGPAWKPDYRAYDEACDKDLPIRSIIELFHCLHAQEKKIQIWTGRCESAREKTYQWLLDNCAIKYVTAFCPEKDLKMRPIGNQSPMCDLKMNWLLDERRKGTGVKMAFESDASSIHMWRRMDVFVLDCRQRHEEDLTYKKSK